MAECTRIRARQARLMPWVALCVGVGLGLMGMGSSWAEDDGDRATRRPPAPTNSAYQRECAACHMAYPPGLLPAASWRTTMSNLNQHFGSDASLDAGTVNQITQWLVTYADAGPRAPQDRITRTPWFVHEHDEISPAVWRRASIKTAGNCIACHRGAEQGRFSEHDVRIPR